jgi:hypothetical protein
MDEISWLTPILIVIDTGRRLMNAFYNYILAIISKYRTAHFGWPAVFLYWLPLINTDRIHTMHWNINCWKDEEIIQWKSNYISSCNAVSVAVR